MQQDQNVITISVSGADIVTARMPYPHEQKSMGIGWVALLVITRASGVVELYDATKHVVCVNGDQAVKPGRCDHGSEPSYRCILTAGHPGAHDPGPDPDGHGPDCQCRYCFDEPEPDPAEYDPGPEVDDQGGMSEYRYHEPEPWQ